MTKKKSQHRILQLMTTRRMSQRQILQPTMTKKKSRHPILQPTMTKKKSRPPILQPTMTKRKIEPKRDLAAQTTHRCRGEFAVHCRTVQTFQMKLSDLGLTHCQMLGTRICVANANGKKK